MLVDKIKQIVHNTVVRTLVTYVADNVVKAKVSGQLQLEDAQLQQVLTVVRSSLEAGYALTDRTLTRELKEAINDEL